EAVLSLGADNSANGSLSELLTRHRDQFKDLFIVSDVSLLKPDEVAVLKQQAGDRQDFADNGTFARVTTSPGLTLKGRRAPGVKCHRCWVYFDDGGHPELCPRCRVVVGARA